MMAAKRGTAPVVPKSQEELDQEAQDAVEARQQDEVERIKMRERAGVQAQIFLLCALACAVFGSALAWTLGSMEFAWGVTAGAGTMVLNLWLLTVLLAKILMGDAYRAMYAVALVLTFGLLVLATGIVVRTFPDSALGFGMGLTVPVAAGLLFGLFRRAGSPE